MPEQNAYDSLLQNDTAQRVRVSMMDAVDKQPDTEAKLQGLAKTYGMPVDAVRLRQPEIERQARLDALDYDTLANRYPKTANALANPNAAAIAHDDVDNMSGLERAARGLFGGAVEGLGMLASGAGVGLNILQRNLTQAAGALLPTPRGGPMTEGALDSLNGSLMGEDWKYVGGLTKRTARQDIMVPEAQRTFTDQVLGGLGQIGVQIPASIFLGPAPLYLQGLDAMDEKVSKDNAPQWKKDLATVGGAAITGITEKWALDKLMGPIATPVKNALAAALARIGIAAASEGGQEFSENLLQDLLRKGVTNPDAPVQIGDSVQEGAVGATVGGIVRSIIEGALHVRVRAGHQAQQAQQAEARAQVLGELAKLAEASKVRERDPAQFAQFMQSLTEEGVPHLYVDANALMQSGVDINQVAMALPSVAEQIERAHATGGDLVIPTAEFLTAGPGNEFMQTLIDHARTSVDAPSPAQGREYMQEHGDQLRQDIDKVLAEREQDRARQASHDAVRDEFKAQLDSAKRFTADVNAQYAILPASFYSVTAAKLGITPQELAQRYGLQVQAKEVQGGQQLDQGVLVTDQVDEATGLPLNSDGTVTVYHHTSAANAQAITKSGVLKAQAEPDVYVTSRKETDTGYGDTAVPVRVRPDQLQVDDEFPDGRVDYRISVKRPGGSLRVGVGEATPQTLNQSTPLPETIEIDGKQRPTTNSNGQPIAATEEGVRNFWKWFGDSAATERAISSKQRRNELRPLVVYHGTRANFDSFAPVREGNVTTMFGDEETVTRHGIFFAESSEFADTFAKQAGGGNANVVPVYLKIENPLYLDEGFTDEVIGELVAAGLPDEQAARLRHRKADMAWAEFDDDAGEALVAAMRAAGYDGALTVEAGVGVEGEDQQTAWVALDPTQIKSTIGNSGEFDPTNPSILAQQARGSITLPEDLTKAPAIISLFKGADLSTFIHESGHFFLEVQADLAARIQGQIDAGASVTDGEREIVADMDKLLAWFGVKGDMGLSALDIWHTMTLEEKRIHHEQFARGFEAYMFEGSAPSIELQSMFQKFRAWLVSVYKELKALNVTLTDDVRGVMDRMLASTEAIQEAEAARRMGPLFKTAEEAGMSLDEFAAYHALATDATQSAVNELQARGLRDMRWLANAKDKKLKELQAQYKTLRSGVRKEVRAEVMSQPVYRAWQFLTGKGDAQETAQPDAKVKQDPKALDVVEDSLFKAIAKLGGLSKDEAVSLWGVDPKEKIESGVFGTPVLRKTGGVSVDDMAARLTEVGYLLPDENGTHDVNALFEAFDSERRGSPVYSAWHAYQRPEDGAPVEPLPEFINFGKLNTGTLAEQYGTKEGGPLAKLQALKMTSEARGIHPDVVADTFGFTSGDELIQAILAAEPPASVIEGMTDQRMLERFGDLGTLEGLTKAADRAIHNEARARFVATEIKALETGMRVRAPGATGKSTVDVLTTVARQQAEAIIARTKVRDLRPGQYTAAEARAARAAEKAMLAGKTEDALAEKRHQIINLQAAKATMNAQDEMDKTVKYLRKFDEKRPKGIDAEYMDQIDALLVRFDLAPASLKAIDKRKTLVEWVESQRDQGMEPDIPPELLNEALRKSYKDMTVEELRGLRDTVRQIEKLGRNKNKLLTAKAAREFAEVRDEIHDSIVQHAGDRKANTRTPADALGRSLKAMRDFGAAHIKAATYARVMDGGLDGGPLWEYLIRTANDRGDMETTMRAEATQRLYEILEPALKGGKMHGKGQFFPSIKRSMNREQVITMALNMGNESNIQRMLGGEGWTIQQVMPVVQTLSASDWATVQAVWDHFETYRPLIGAKEKRIYGKEPEWVEAMPFAIQSSDGVTVNMRGGYYPVKFDPLASNRAEQHNDAEAAKRQLQGAYTSATTRRGFTKARVAEVNGQPLLYSLQGVYSGVNDVIHDLAWHEWLIDANKILRSDKIDGAIREHYGPEVVRQFKTWVADVATGEQGLQAELDSALGRLRHGVSIAGLGFNVMSAAMQPLGLTQSIVRVGAKWVGRGMAQYVASPIAKTREVNGKSDFMANRSRTRFRELNELRNQVEGEHPIRTAIGGSAYFLMMRAQQMVDTPTWLGAYEKAISEGNAEDRAIALADQAVIDAQGGGQTKDLSAIERGGPAQKLFTVFYSFMNTALNAGVAKTMAADTPAKKAKLAADYLMLYTVPAVLGAILKDALTPGDSGDWDEWDTALKKLLAEQIGFLFGLMVVAREFGEAAKSTLGLVEHSRDYSGPAGTRMISDTYTLGKQVSQGELDDPFRKAAINVLGDMFALPSAQINRTITGAEALSEGETQNPGALVFGYQKP